MFVRRFLAVALSAAVLSIMGGVAWAQGADTEVKAKEEMKSEGAGRRHMAKEAHGKLMTMMKENMEGVEKAMKTLEDAKSSGDAAKMKEAVDSALTSLKDVKGRMDTCHQMINEMKSKVKEAKEAKEKEEGKEEKEEKGEKK